MSDAFQDNEITDPDQLSFLKTTNIATAFAGPPAEELIIDYSNKLIGLYVGAGDSPPNNLTNDGVTIKAVYSKLKDAWRTDADLIKFDFPMGPITDESFELINGWNWDKGKSASPQRVSGTDGVQAETTELLRTGGWQVVNTANVTTEEWAGIITLGALADTDQVYYQQVDDETVDNTANFLLKGRVNQAVQIFDSAPSPDTSNKTYFKVFVREWKKTYASSAFDEIGVTTATFQAYRFPLINAVDLNVTHAEEVVNGTAGFITNATGTGTAQTYTTGIIEHGLAVDDVVTITGMNPAGYNATSASVTAVTSTTFTIAGSESGAFVSGGAVQLDLYAAMAITYARDTDDERVLNEEASTGTQGYVTGVWQSGTAYNVGDVAQDTNSPARWFIVTVAGTSSGDASNLAGGSDTGVTWAAYSFEREINTDNFFAFTVAIDGDTGTANANDGDASISFIYEYVQAELRKASDIDDTSPGTVIGKTADTLLTFVGPTLVTSRGVYIDSFAGVDQNSIEFFDALNVKREFNFVSLFTINFGANLQADPYAKYFVFFTSGDGANDDYGEINAILVNHIDAVPGQMTGDVNPTNTANERTNVQHLYDYDVNIQRGAGTNGTDAPVTVIGIGLEESQWVKAASTIGRNKTSNVTLTSAKERNYEQGTTFP
jgi:hypothetical protein